MTLNKGSTEKAIKSDEYVKDLYVIINEIAEFIEHIKHLKPRDEWYYIDNFQKRQRTVDENETKLNTIVSYGSWWNMLQWIQRHFLSKIVGM